MSLMPVLTHLMRLAAPLLLAIVVLVSGLSGGGSCGAEHDCCDDAEQASAQVIGASAECSEACVGEAGDRGSDDTEPCDCPDDCSTCHCAFSVLGKVVSPFAPMMTVPDFERSEPYVVWLDAPPEGARATLFRPPRNAA